MRQSRENAHAARLLRTQYVLTLQKKHKDSAEFAENCTISGCQHHCARTVNGPACYCNASFQLAEDGKTCKDFDECTLYGTCSQTCQNTEGSYTCGCVEGYLLQPDNKSCKAKNQPVERLTVLLIASTQNILATYLSGAPVQGINPTSTKQTTAMDFNYAEETVCWINMGDSPSLTTLNCAKIPNLKGFTEERTINISLSLHRKLPKMPNSIDSINECSNHCVIYKYVGVLQSSEFLLNKEVKKMLTILDCGP
ncbi:unnamed protein product [Ranitomeya imitator]|uniref:EGF-like domain-containing protein n=1 Tax=Ranitomeya imitator TaxID=111125 RepID=A0ABN9KU01_9NEOB|nr:unnamed protein product [Ranitomeya imitator]